jgi:DNA recombination protein RmuC
MDYVMKFESLPVHQLTLDPLALLAGLAGLTVVLLITLLIIILRQHNSRALEARDQALRAYAFETEMAELKGRLQTLAEITVTRQSEVSRALHERLDNVSHRLGHNMQETTQKTTDSLAQLQERLAVIDTAQRNITELSSKVVTLQDILANKQARGAFGQGRMEAIIKDGLPRDSYTFQAQLSNGKRPDCLVHLPGNPAGIVIDAKFPLEGFEAFRTSRSEESQKEAAKAVRIHVGRHIDDIAEKYFLPGETQDTAILFVPSEAVYADLHEFFPDLIQKAYRARIIVASPNMLMLAVQTMQAIMKDVQMREAAGLIKREVTNLMNDLHRLRDRTLNLQRHFGQANKDIEQILTSSDKIASRGRRIETLDFDREADKIIEKRELAAKKPAPADKPKLLAGE